MHGLDLGCFHYPGDLVLATSKASLTQVTEDAWAAVDAFIAAADYRFMPEREGLIVSKIAVSLMKFLGSS